MTDFSCIIRSRVRDMRWLWLVIALPALFSLSSLMCDLIPCMCVALVVCATSVCCSVVSSRRGWQYRLWHAACVHRGRPANSITA